MRKTSFYVTIAKPKLILLEYLFLCIIFLTFFIYQIKLVNDDYINAINIYLKQSESYAQKIKMNRRQVFIAKVNRYVRKISVAYDIDPDWVLAVISVESGYNPNITGSFGEIGMMQIKLSTARIFNSKLKAKDLYNWKTNILYGVMYLSDNIHRYGRLCGTLAYNGGAGILKHKSNMEYYRKIKKEYLNEES